MAHSLFYVNRNLLLGIAAAAAASAPIFFQAPAAHAACVANILPTGQNCSTFDPSSVTNLEGYGFTDANWVQNNQLTGIRFTADESIHGGLSGSSMTFAPDPVTISNIFYSFDNGVNWSNTNVASSVTMPSGTGQSANALSSGITAPSAWGGDFQVKFTLSTLTSSNAGQMAVRVSSNGAGGTNTQTRLYTSSTTPTTGTPGPLPLLGAGAAFGLSRRLRSRIRVAA